MIQYQGDSAKPADRLAKDSKLCERLGAVVINAFASQLIVAVERADSERSSKVVQRKFSSSAHMTVR
jgi:hypothetical protein